MDTLKSSTALSILRYLIKEFPGLTDHESEVNGADLVDALTHEISDCPELMELPRTGG